jgi:uncharacterized protein YndB with AHSA1/START domain
MSIQTADTAVRTSIVVEAPVERAFDVFTQQMPSWWHPDHHILEGELAEMVFEPRVGGHVYDRATDGRECRWARVLAYEPPRRFVISWDIGLDWQIEPNPERASEIEVRFLPEGPARARLGRPVGRSVPERRISPHKQPSITVAAAASRPPSRSRRRPRRARGRARGSRRR